MTFNPKNKAHKASLYKTLVAVSELENEPFDRFLQQPFDPPWNLAPGYRRNLQRGDYDKIRAQVLYDYLLDQHFTASHAQAPDLFPQTPEMRWREILENRATNDGLRMVRVPTQLGLVERKSRLEAVDQTLKLGEFFALELTSSFDGFAVALQGVANKWYPIDLGPEVGSPTTISKGTNLMPQSPNGELDPLNEEQHGGKHEFVVVTSRKKNIPENVKKLVAWSKQEKCELKLVDVRFVT